MARSRALFWTWLVLVAANLLHVLDHALQSRPESAQLSTEVQTIGALGNIALLIAGVLILRGSAYAPPFAVLIGFGTALGLIAVHLLPHWSAFSDPYTDLSLSAGSWLSLAFFFGAAVAFGYAGLRELMRRTSDTGGALTRS
jgi:hypothetical protein